MTGQSLKLPKGSWPLLLILDLLFSHMAFGNIGSTKYILLSATALLIFVYPPVVTVTNSVLDRQLPGLLKSVAIATSFIGLAVMLGVGFEVLDPRGVIIGLTTGIACAVNMVWVSRQGANLLPFMTVFYQPAVSAVALTFLAFQLDELRLPNITSGWWGLAFIVVLQSTSILLFYFAINHIGTERTGLLNNLQPVASIIAAMFLFQEVLTGDRIIGVVMVLGGILLEQLSDGRALRAAG